MDVIFIDKLEDGRDCRQRRLIPTEQKVEAKENLEMYCNQFLDKTLNPSRANKHTLTNIWKQIKFHL